MYQNSCIVIFSFLCISVAYSADLPDLKWWQTSVFYHLYPRSFKDSDGDGIGDLKGITENAPEHLKDLGIGAVWISPIFKSPMVDFGYDVSDYLTLEEMFGDLNDFEELKEKLHANGIKLLLDFVPNHTSDQHEWFQKSLKKIAPYDNYYVWKDPKGFNGTVPIPPTNWRSEFSGTTWKYVEERKQFYLHNFLEQQPDLNYNNAQLVEAIKNILRYWLDKGVDGFRLDAVNYLFEDPSFRDDPYVDPNITDDPSPNSVIRSNSINQPEMYDMVKQWRQVLDDYTKRDGRDRILFTEAYISVNTVNATLEFYNQGDSVIPFNFFLLVNLNGTSTAEDFHNNIHLWLDNMPEKKWPNWVWGNHDRPRVSEIFGNELVDGLNMLNLLLPGTPIVYNGEEIGMQDLFIKWEDTVDPLGKKFGPKLYQTYSRDPERTPFQWDDSTSAGFSTNRSTWLPVNPNYYDLNLKHQKSAPNSHYKIFKRLTQLRTENVFKYGAVETHVLSKYIFAISRSLQGEDTYIVVIHLGSFEETITLSDQISSLPQTLKVHTASLNSKYQTGDEVSTINSGFSLRPKESLVLTTFSKSSSVSSNGSVMGSIGLLVACAAVLSWACFLGSEFGNLT